MPVRAKGTSFLKVFERTHEGRPARNLNHNAHGDPAAVHCLVGALPHSVPRGVAAYCKFLGTVVRPRPIRLAPTCTKLLAKLPLPFTLPPPDSTGILRQPS
jgi:hypothetical protein